MSEHESTARAPESAPAVPPLRQLYVYLAGACNLACRHCWIDPRFEQHTERLLPWATLEAIVDQALPLGLTSIKFTGGEPLLHPEMATMAGALARRGLQLRMETNGTLVDPALARALGRAGVQVALSLDGATAAQHDALRGVAGAFERAVAGARRLRQHGVPLQVITSVHRGNAPGLPAVVALARELGAHSVKVNPIHAVARSQAMARRGELLAVDEVLALRDALERQVSAESTESTDFWVDFDVPPAFRPLSRLQQRGLGTCGILGILGVLHNGHGALCGAGEHEEALDFGDLLAQGVAPTWRQNPVLQRLRRGVPGGLKGVCAGCLMRSYCLGKCLANTFSRTGDLLGGFGFCEEALARGLFPASRRREGDGRG